MGIVLLVGGQSLCAQSKAEKKAEKEQQVKMKLENGNYEIDVDWALPMQGRSVNLTSPYSLEIRNDSVFSYLPYFGRAYSVPYGGGSGMIFKEPVSDYTLVFDEKGTAQVRFKTRTQDGVHEFNIQVFSNGSASIQARPANRQGISYRGNLSLENDQERGE